MVFACMFWSGGKIINDNTDPVTGEMKINPGNVFAALFAIMFGASHMGSASAMGPDAGKASAAATRIFKISDYPSQIDAMDIDKNKYIVRKNPENCIGKIEFKNVWFRYPTRK